MKKQPEKQKQVPSAKQKFFESELKQYGLEINQKEYIRGMMFDGVNIMTKKQITKCIEEHIDLRGW